MLWRVKQNFTPQTIYGSIEKSMIAMKNPLVNRYFPVSWCDSKYIQPCSVLWCKKFYEGVTVIVRFICGRDKACKLQLRTLLCHYLEEPIFTAAENLSLLIKRDLAQYLT